MIDTLERFPYDRLIERKSNGETHDRIIVGLVSNDLEQLVVS
jgi:hypothetical protein